MYEFKRDTKKGFTCYSCDKLKEEVKRLHNILLDIATYEAYRSNTYEEVAMAMRNIAIKAVNKENAL